MFTDEVRDKVWNEIRQHDVRAFADQLRSEVFAERAKAARNPNTIAYCLAQGQ